MKHFNKFFFTLGITCLVWVPNISNASEIKDRETVEIVGISMRQLVICHQHEWRNLTVNLEFNAEISNRTQAIRDHVRVFLEQYSQPDDFWEIMNTKLVHSLLESFPAITTMKSILSLEPDRTLKFQRESNVQFDKGTMKESFGFTKSNSPISEEILNLHVVWDMKENLNPATDYPDFQWVNEAMESFFKEHPMHTSDWKSLKPMLQSYLLEKFSTLSSIHVKAELAE